nr:unnamed protein product [Callosobruchus analis]
MIPEPRPEPSSSQAASPVFQRRANAKARSCATVPRLRRSSRVKQASKRMDLAALLQIGILNPHSSPEIRRPKWHKGWIATNDAREKD